ncbi:alpha/beta fold hydrolase [Actinomadura formosensis]|uniref:alpha/beta fold hydrolase n=1 Tax=Actinomadura formosensis TaxID=60706 RepID=UPI003D902A7A
MRKVLVCGAAFAATCLAAVAVPVGAHAAPPVPGASSGPSAPPAGEPGTAAPSGEPQTGDSGSQSPSASATTLPGNGRPGADGEPDGTATARAVMVTPQLPKFRTYAYGKDAAQKIDAYWRQDARQAGPRPVVLILHGGYWLQGDKGGGWKYFARRLTEEGFVVLSANYRLSPKAHWPAQRDDSLAALAFIKKYARVWNADPARVAVVGSSAGGQLATQLGTLGTGTRQVRGVVALSPPNNPYLAYQDGAKPGATPGQRKLRRAVVDLMNCEPGVTVGAEPDPETGAEPEPGTVTGEVCLPLLDDASTVTHVSPGDAPMLLMHATGDFVPVTQSTGLAAALRAAGVQATVKTVEGHMHATDMLSDEQTYPTIVGWLKGHLKPGE